MEMRCVLRAGPTQGLDPSNPIVIPDDNSMEEETQSNCLPATANSTAMQENNWIEQFPSRSDLLRSRWHVFKLWNLVPLPPLLGSGGLGTLNSGSDVNCRTPKNSFVKKTGPLTVC